MNRQNLNDSRLTYTIAALGSLLLAAFYALYIIAQPVISPEIALAYLSLSGIHTLGDIIHKFVVFNETWYRPFTFYLTNFILYHLIDIHDTRAIRTASVLFVLLNGIVVATLSSVIFRSSRVERILVFSLMITLPSYFYTTYEGSGVVDGIFNIFVNLFVLSFLPLLQRVSDKLGTGAPTGEHTRRNVLLCMVFIVCTITSQERGMAVFAMIGALCLFYYSGQLATGRIRLQPATTFMAAFSALVCVLYLCFVYASKKSWSGQDYRTGFEPVYFFPNLLKAIEFPLRLYLFKTGKSSDVHAEPVFNLLAVPFIIALAAFLCRVLRSDDRKEKSRLAILAILYVCSLLIPVWFGGNQWHFYTAATYVSIATGRAVWYWALKCAVRNQVAILALFFAWLAAGMFWTLQEELGQSADLRAKELAEGTDLQEYVSVVPEALTDPALRSVRIPQVVYYDTGSLGELTWPFGGQGNLFKYLYSDPRIIEIALVRGKVLASDRHLCPEAETKTHIAAFGFDAQHISWHPLPVKDYCSR